MKYVLISQQGSGTNLFRAFLNSHPDIVFDNELFSYDSRNGLFDIYKDSGKSIEAFLDNFYNKKESVVGFDLKYGQMGKEYANILSYLQKNKIGVIQLFRDTGRTFLRRINEKSNVLRHEDLIEHCKMVSARSSKIRTMFGDGKYVELHYEDMTRGRKIESLPEDFERKVLEWFDVPYRKLSIDKSFHIRKDKLKVRY